MLETTGDRIKLRREELGLTQTDLAIRMGYKSRAAICNVEKNKEDLTTTRIRKFAEALDCTPAYLMGWDSADVLQDADVPMSAKIKNPSENNIDTQKAVDIYNQIMELPQRDQEELFSYLQYLRTRSDSPHSNS